MGVGFLEKMFIFLWKTKTTIEDFRRREIEERDCELQAVGKKPFLLFLEKKIRNAKRVVKRRGGEDWGRPERAYAVTPLAQL